MNVALIRRRHGRHATAKKTRLPGTFGDYATPNGYNQWAIDEHKLLDALPAEFLPKPPDAITIAVDDGIGATAQHGLDVFRNRAGRSSDAYTLRLEQRPPQPPPMDGIPTRHPTAATAGS